MMCRKAKKHDLRQKDYSINEKDRPPDGQPFHCEATFVTFKSVS